MFNKIILPVRVWNLLPVYLSVSQMSHLSSVHFSTKVFGGIYGRWKILGKLLPRARRRYTVICIATGPNAESIGTLLLIMVHGDAHMDDEKKAGHLSLINAAI
jgi:hypothetical protein